MSELIDMMVEEKLDHKEYLEMAEEEENEEYKEMFKMIADQEHNHYKMLKEYMKKKMEESEM